MKIGRSMTSALGTELTIVPSVGGQITSDLTAWIWRHHG
jgi:hypothetical protein